MHIFQEMWKRSNFSTFYSSATIFLLTKYPVLYRTGTFKYSAGNATDKKSLANCL